jgi:hypothetical protein
LRTLALVVFAAALEKVAVTEELDDVSRRLGWRK